MHQTPISRVIAAAFGLCAFAVAVLAGLSVANPALTVLWHATISMIVCYVLGTFIGMVCERVADHAVQGFIHGNPLPEGGDASGEEAAPVQGVEERA